jgi:zinc protease
MTYRYRGLVSLAHSIALAVIGFALAAPQHVNAQTPPAATVPLDAPLPMSPAVTAGMLDNGLRYFIRENPEPENRVLLRLVVDAGSLLEGDDARGAAHFLEHMAFNGTERFEKQQIIEFMESIGMRFGPGINATTSFDETVYMLTLPTDDPERIETAFAILEDWMGGLTLDPDEVEQERAIVLEEWRSGQGAAARVRDQQLPVLFRDSRYAQRLPIGTADSIRAIDRDTLRRFYDDWYRPELMAVIAVGDFDGAFIEELVHRHFAHLPASGADAPARPVYDMPTHSDTLLSIVADPEVPTTTVQIAHKLAPDADFTIAGFRESLVEQLYSNLLNLRLQEIARDPDAPFLAAASQLARPIRATRAYMLAGVVAEDGVEPGLAALLAESERVARFGFTESELERGKTAMLREMERRLAARASRPSQVFAGQYAESFLTGRPIPAIDYQSALQERFVPGITLEEVNSIGRRWNDDASRVVLVTAPASATLPDEAALAAVLREAEQADVGQYVDTISDGILLGEPPAGSRIVATRNRDADVTEWDLANGVRVVLKPTDFNQDQVLMRAFKAGGGSLAGDEDLVAVQTAVPVLTAGGLGDLDATALQRALTGRVAAVNPVINENDTGLAGQASAQDLQTLFELIYLRFTAPRADERAFAAVQGQARLALGNRDNNPVTALNDAFNRLMTQDHPRARPLTADMLGQMSLERSLAFYRERFSNANGTTFIFIGAFDLDTMRPLVERYLGGLPASEQTETWQDHGVRRPEGAHEELVYAGREPTSQTRLAFHGVFDVDIRGPRERTLFGAMGLLLQTHLRNVLREELGGTYGVGVNSSMSWVPEESYALLIQFGSDPDRAEELVARIFTEIEALRRDGPDAERVADTREAMLRQYETNQRQNGWWMTALGGSYQYEAEPGPEGLLAYPGMVAALTAADIHDGFRRLIDTGNYVRVTLLPEGMEPGR